MQKKTKLNSATAPLAHKAIKTTTAMLLKCEYVRKNSSLFTSTLHYEWKMMMRLRYLLHSKFLRPSYNSYPAARRQQDVFVIQKNMNDNGHYSASVLS